MAPKGQKSTSALFLRFNDRERQQLQRLVELLGARSLTDAVRIAIEREVLRIEMARQK